MPCPVYLQPIVLYLPWREWVQILCTAGQVKFHPLKADHFTGMVFLPQPTFVFLPKLTFAFLSGILIYLT